MSVSVMLDTGPLGVLTRTKTNDETKRCRNWLRRLLRQRVTVLLPELADYELRRELLRAKKSVRSLDRFGRALTYLPLTTEGMRRAAEIWADMRQIGMPTAGDKELDGDVILCAQALTYQAEKRESVVVATMNVGHISRMTQAALWTDIG